MATLPLAAYRRPWFGPEDRLFHRCLSATAALGAALAIVMMLVPVRRYVVTAADELPTRFARLILEKPRTVPAPAPAAPRVAAPAPGDAPPRPEPVPAPAPPPVAGGRATAPRTEVSAGTAGRARAEREVAAASGGGALERSLEGLGASLGALDAGPATAGGGRGRGTRTLAAADEGGRMGPLAAGGSGSGAGADLGGSGVTGSRVAIGDIASGDDDGGAGGGGTGGGAGNGSDGSARAPGAYRSNASLLAVIQRHAAGIQYCYGNELKRDPSLRGKLVVALTVEASGAVSEAVTVHDSVGSSRLTSCALAQIREWRFPAIPRGVTTFQVPFVFTPPE
jgi:TonB family protein